MKEFAGKVALVTGTTGIGRATAIRLAAGGARIVACGIDPTANAELTRDATERGHGSTFQVETCDVTSLDAVRSVIARMVAHFGHHCELSRDSSLWHSS
jgi:meso-butanediol dehydrogenase/(S,S)-butanediol dehydrogenase/diacetyl reductase